MRGSILIVFCCFFISQNVMAEEAFVSASILNFRSSPINGLIIGRIPYGTKVKVIEKKNGWAKIFYSDKEGWVSSEYLSSSGFSEIPNKYSYVTEIGDVDVTDEEAFVSASILNLRSSPLDGLIIGRIPYGTKVKVVEKKKGWAKIFYSNQEGWVSRDYLSSSGFSAAKPQYSRVSKIRETDATAARAFVSASILNFRSSPLDGQVIGKIPYGTKVNVIEKKKGWAKILYSNQEGWVSRDYLSSSGFFKIQNNYSRVREARAMKEKIVELILGDFTSTSKILIIAYKMERKLEVWILNSNLQLELRKTYEFSGYSGDLGPKRIQGDGQIPEGFYIINRFNPYSSFHLSLGINYPNYSDQTLGVKGHLGGDIFIHGSNVTIGCIPITDDKIRELYLIALEAWSDGQSQIPVYIFPCKFDTEVCKNRLKKNSVHNSFWKNLAKGYDLFYKKREFLIVSSDRNGRYHFR